jgi:quercetin dioxygenase-like cupin family protein
MKIHKLKDMVKGWFVGNFEPSLFKTDLVEVGVKEYKAGDKEPLHYHKVATEITVIVKGMVVMNGTLYNSGDIITIEPGESTNFEALADTITTVVKLPCVNDDKYIV